MRALLRDNRDIRWLFIAQIISYMGDWFSFVAVGGLVDDATHSSVLVSLVLVALSLPSFLVSPLSGAVVDRFDRRTMLLVVSGFQAVAAAGLLLGDAHRIWALFVFQGLISAFAAFVKPAIDAGIPNLARNPEELRVANALLGSTWGVMLAAGAGIGGLFSQAFGRSAAFVADAASFVIAGSLFALIRRPMQEIRHEERPPMRPLADMGEALRFARKDKVVLALLASKTTFAIGSGTVSILPLLASRVFHWGDGGRGLLLGARGAGVAIGPVLAARYTRSEISRVLLVCGFGGLGFGAFYLGAAWSPVILLSALCLALGHVGGGAQWTLSTFGLQLSTTDALRGRVMAGDYAIVTLVLSLSSVSAGLLVDVWGVRWTMTAFAVSALAAGLTYMKLTAGIIRELNARVATDIPISA